MGEKNETQLLSVNKNSKTTERNILTRIMKTQFNRSYVGLTFRSFEHI